MNYINILKLFYCVDLSPVDCKWGEWSFWSRCTCRNTEKTKRRKPQRENRNGGKECSGPAEKQEKCNPDYCPGLIINMYINNSNGFK